jgi:hypothetical protein
MAFCVFYRYCAPMARYEYGVLRFLPILRTDGALRIWRFTFSTDIAHRWRVTNMAFCVFYRYYAPMVRYEYGVLRFLPILRTDGALRIWRFAFSTDITHRWCVTNMAFYVFYRYYAPMAHWLHLPCKGNISVTHHITTPTAHRRCATNLI